MTDSLKPASEIPVYAGPTPEGFSIQEAPILFAQAAHAAHGGVSKIDFSDREFILFTGKEANEFVWASNELWSYRSSRGAFLHELGEPHVTSSDGDKHRTKRKLINRSFSVSSNMRFLPKIAQVTLSELRAAAEAGKPVKLRQFLPRLIAKFNLATVSQFEMEPESFEKMVRWQLHFIAGVGLAPSRHDEYFGGDEYLADKEVAFEAMGALVDQRLADPNPPDDNFQQILDAREKAGIPGDRDELINELYYVLVAGVQNTTHFVITMLREIYSPPGWLDWLREDLEEWDGYNAMAVAEMERFKAFAMEVQRNRPQTLTLPLIAKEDFAFGGYEIPKDTWCLYVPSFMHFEEENFEDPMTFNANRFLDGGRFSPKLNGFFGGGAHVCVGRNVTLLQGPLIVAILLKWFDLDGMPPKDTYLAEQVGGESPEQAEVTILPRTPAPVGV